MLSSDGYDNWQVQFNQEGARLLTALSEVTEGGILEDLQHIGATSVPGLAAKPCVDIGLSVWPFPLEPQRWTALETLGYKSITGYEDAPEQRFRHITGNFQLYIVDAGSELWLNYLLIRDPTIIQTIGRARMSTSAGISFLAPELVLLFKSKNTSGQERSKDQADFEEISAHLEPERRAWLRWALLATDPTHPWIAHLAS